MKYPEAAKLADYQIAFLYLEADSTYSVSVSRLRDNYLESLAAVFAFGHRISEHNLENLRIF